MFLNAPEGNIVFGAGGAVRTVIDTDGTFRPNGNSVYNLGSLDHRWQRASFQQIEIGNTAGTLGVIVSTGSGSPEGIITANPGSMFLSNNGNVYRKNSGTGNTGWVTT